MIKREAQDILPRPSVTGSRVQMRCVRGKQRSQQQRFRKSFSLIDKGKASSSLERRKLSRIVAFKIWKLALLDKRKRMCNRICHKRRVVHSNSW